MARIRSILRGMDGILGFSIAAEHAIRITYDDLRTDPQKITDALHRGGVHIPGKPEPIEEKPPSNQ